MAGLYERSRGPRDDVRDAFRRAEELRTNQVPMPVFRAPRHFARLRELGRVHSMLGQDVIRVQSRLKAMHRGHRIPAPGKTVYSLRRRDEWLAELPLSCRTATARLPGQYDALMGLKKEAEKEPLAEAAKQPIAKVLATAAGMGPIRTARFLPVVVPPRRFRTRKQFWAYCGRAVLVRSSSDRVRTEHGGWVRASVPHARGLNRNRNVTSKSIFGVVATTVLTNLPHDPLHEHDQEREGRRHRNCCDPHLQGETG